MKVKERNISTNNFILPVLFIVFAIIFEIANFLYLGFKDSNGNQMILPSYFLFDFAIILMIAGFIYVLHNKILMRIFFYFFISIQFILNIVNATMYSVLGDVLSFDLIFLGAEATAALTIDLIDWFGILLNLTIFAVMIVTTIILFKYNKSVIKIKYFSTPIIVLAVFIMCQSLGLGLYEVQQENLTGTAAGETEIESSDQYLWENFQFKLDAFKKFGYYGFYTKSILNLIFFGSATEEEIEFYENYIDSGYQEENPDAPLYGDNLIVILCESLDWFAIDPYNTPTLYSLATGNDSISFTGFYGRNRTNNSEGIVINGSMPRTISLTQAYDNGYNFDYALPKIFKETSEEGQTTTMNFVHANTASYYSRDYSHTNAFGFDQVYGLEDYTGEQVKDAWGHWISDYDFTSNLMDKIIPDTDRFLTFIATMSTHGPYTYRNPYYEEYYQVYEQNYEKFAKWLEENTTYTIPSNETDYEHFYYYKSAFIDLDRTVANLISELETRGLSDSTSIVLFSDHNAYYHDLSLKVKGIEKVNYQDTEAYNIPFIIYSPALTKESGGEVIDTFCNTYDILPTICDIYGLSYNTNLLFGYSVFSSEIENSFFASHLNGMFTENIYSLNITDIDIVGDNVTEEEIEKFKELANNYYKKQEYLEVIYTNGINGNISLSASYI